MKYIIAAATDVGSYRKVNQDKILVKKCRTRDGEIVFAMICDGMGGLDKGDLASKIVTEYFAGWFQRSFKSKKYTWDIQNIVEDWKQLIDQANTRIYEYSINNGLKMGTTLSAILVNSTEYVIAHIGDTRIYRINHEVSQLTEDHSLVAREVKEGRLTLEQAQYDRRKHLLLRSVGIKAKVETQVIVGSLKDEEGLLICSDGFWNKIREDEIQDLFERTKNKDQGIVKHKLGELIDRALSRNEKDNISAIVILKKKEKRYKGLNKLL